MDRDGRRVVRVTGGGWSLNDGGGTPMVIHGVTGPGRGNGENGSVLELCGLKRGAKRSNRGFLLAITGIIASKSHFRIRPTQSNTVRSVVRDPYHV